MAKETPFDRARDFVEEKIEQTKEVLGDSFDGVGDEVRKTVKSTAKKLEKVGAQVEPPIQTALKGNITLEARRRLEQILKDLPDRPGPETVRTTRAIMALERIGSAEARGVVEALARGAPGARETEEAKGSLERLRQRATWMH